MKPRPAVLLTACLASTTLATAVPDALQPGWLTEEDAGGPPKYFHEPGGDEALDHYDARYFQAVVGYDEHLVNLRLLIRSYLTVFAALGVDTWLAHGTLLGWWWNGRILPWDHDLDAQVTASSLRYLAAHYNRTTHEYRYVAADDDAAAGAGAPRTRAYLLDVNPHHADRARGNARNVIDARWIDTASGMFLDITGLAERDPVRAPGVWACKNDHRYQTAQLFPMRESVFEGVPARVPYAVDTLLVREYGKRCLVTTAWRGHEWDPALQQWVRQDDDLDETDGKEEGI